MTTTIELTVHEGRVQCPQRGELDVEQCFICPSFAGLHDDDDCVAIRCHLRRSRWDGYPYDVLPFM